MRKVAIIGHVDHKTTVIEALVKAVEEKTGEKVEIVTVHKEDIKCLERPLDRTEEVFIIEKLPELKEPFIPRLPKGHIRPYKFHR